MKRKRSNAFDFSVRQRFLFFGRNSGIHGLVHLFQADAHSFARLFWLVILLASSGCLYLLFVSAVERGSEVSYTPDTRYLTWNTIFPGVTVCETYSPKTAARKIAEHYPELVSSLSFDLKRFVADLTFGRGICNRAVCVPCGTPVACDVPWRDVVEKIHKSCTELISDCRYSGTNFPCCEKFKKVDSEYGPCYSFNNLQAANSTDVPMASVNLTTGPGVLTFRLLSDAQVSVHSPEELSTNNLDRRFKFEVKPVMENRVTYLFSIIEIENDVLLEADDTSMRGCRYLHEKPPSVFYNNQVYSYGACKLARNTEHAFEHCNCVHPVRDTAYKDKYCNYTGLTCLVNYENFKVKSETDDDRHDETDCLPSCSESEISYVHISRRWATEETVRGTLTQIEMSHLPTMRYKRNLLRNNLDLVVSVGGMVGLFFGASVLSLAELCYLLIRKPSQF